MTLVSNGGTTTLGLYDAQSQLEKKADITYVDNKVDPLIGGHKGFATLAQAQAAQGTLPAGSVVEVTNDSTASNNGLYLWNGTILTKSAYDPLTQANENTKNKLTPIANQLNSVTNQVVKNGFKPNSQKVPLIVGENGKAIIDSDANGNIDFKSVDYEFKRGFGAKPLILMGEDNKEISTTPDTTGSVTQQELSNAVSTLNTSIKKEDQKLAGYGLIDFFESIRLKANKAGRLSICFFGDSTTQGSDGLSIPDEVYRILGKKIGFGGIGFVPMEATAMCTYDAASFDGVTFYFTKNDWQTWNYFSASPPTGYKGWGVKGGAYADSASTGILELNINPNRRIDYLDYDKAKVFYFAVGGDVTFTINGTTVTATAVADTENPTVSTHLIDSIGVATSSWRVQVQRTGGTGTLHIGGVELINSKGGVVVSRFAIGGYKAVDHTGQSATSQRAYLSALGCDLAIINLGQNDSATSAATWKTQIQEMINRIRADAPTRPILLTRWWTTALDSKDLVLNELAAENDLQIVDVRNVVPSAAWSVSKGINLTGVTTDPHLNRKGSTYVARYFLKHLNIESITENLRSV